MKRSKRMMLVCHCVLNSNSKVEGLSQYEGVFKEIIDIIHEEGIGIIQLPCPEMIIYGIKRWGHVKEQFNTLFYRENCRHMLKPIIGQVKSYIDAGYEIVGVLGIDGSPSCGVNLTCSGDLGGEFSNNCNLKTTLESVKEIKSSGVFIEELKEYLMEYKIEIPFVAIGESDVYSSLNDMRDFIKNKKAEN